MTKRTCSRALMGLVIAVLVAGLALTPTLARDDQKPAPDANQPAQPAPPEPEKAKPAAPAAPKAESTRPPTHGKFVGDHWTPYDPPSVESFPQGSKVHIIEKGDTLWDLAGKNLENPFLWPQIWEGNQYITDSHWIYPGDPLLIPGKPTVIGEKGPEPAIEMLEPPKTAEGGEAAPSAPEAPAPAQPAPAAQAPAAPRGPVLEPSAGESDVYCSSFIVDEFQKPDLEIREREDGSRTILGDGDIVYLNRGMNSSMAPGDEYTVLVDQGPVPHPVFSETVGEGLRMVGRVRVIALQESSATAEIVQACDGIEVGMPLVPFEEIPVPLTTPAPFRPYGAQMQTENAGYIVEVSPDKAAIGQGDVVNIDMGSDNGLRPGDILTVFREWGGSVRYDSPASYIDGQQLRAEKARASGKFQPANYAQSILGQVVILTTQKHTAMAKVVVSTREMNLGDRVAAR